MEQEDGFFVPTPANPRFGSSVQNSEQKLRRMPKGVWSLLASHITENEHMVIFLIFLRFSCHLFISEASLFIIRKL